MLPGLCLPPFAVSSGAPTTWTPVLLSSLRAWYKGDTLTGATGTPIASWTDASGNGFHAIQANSGFQPKVETGGLNGMTVLRSDGSLNTKLTLPTAIFSGIAGSEFIFVVKNDADPPSTPGPIIQAAGGGALVDHYPFTDGNIYSGYCSTARQTVGNPTTSLATWHIGSFRSGPSDFAYYLNGAQFFATPTNTFAVPSGEIALFTNGPHFYVGRAAEILIFSARLTAGERQTVEGYLAHKWWGAGAANTLPSGHPYKNSPPPP